MSITFRSLTVRVLPVAASLLLHAVAYGAISRMPWSTHPREPVLLAELVQPDPGPPVPAPPVPEKKPQPRKPDPRPLTLPRPIETPIPKIETPIPKMVEPPPEPAKVEEPPPVPPTPVTPAPETPAPVAPVQPPAPATAPSVAPVEPAGRGPLAAVAPSGRGPLAPVDAPLTTAGDGLPTRSGPTAPARPGPAVAALPGEGITRTAAPRGGYQVKPSYPTSARRAGIQGTTLLAVFVGADGRVGEVVVRQSAGHPDLDEAAAAAVRRWRFEAARRGDEPVAIWVLLPVEFKLR
jgi:protein TonB